MADLLKTTYPGQFGVSGVVSHPFLTTPLTADLDFATYEAIAMACHNGATVPTSPAPVVGQWFLHTPTGRKILLQYDGSNWIPKCSLGTTTIYVDGSGTDAIDSGGAQDSGAFNTAQYAIDCIPHLSNGNVVIDVDIGTFSEDLIIKGKAFTEDYTFTLQGRLTQTADGTMTAEAASVQGTGATQGTVVATDQINGTSAGDIVVIREGFGNEQWRLIDSITGNDTITIVGTWDIDPDDEDFKTYAHGTTINSILIGEGQQSVILKDIKVVGSYNHTGLNASITLDNFACCDLYRVRTDTDTAGYAGVWGSKCKMDAYQCYSEMGAANARAYYPYGRFVLRLYGCKLLGTASTPIGIQAVSSEVFLKAGTIIDNCDSGNGGLYAVQGSIANCFDTAANGYPRIKNCGTYGARATTLSAVVNTSNNQYSNNGTDESADAASFGYID